MANRNGINYVSMLLHILLPFLHIQLHPSSSLGIPKLPFPLKKQLGPCRKNLFNMGFRAAIRRASPYLLNTAQALLTTAQVQ
ncbi:hypothetical protein BD289DRAFT_428834 [Coniella lustricola]|uniref:Uncharacterized protein n=1 Tax=Coniella lustricola TaxID=2025994 RepID=A0A2T3ADM5_9PEZI|nr:hypothetical protein BD289DRAFT_428834 [Coniella lustricola]